MNNSALGAIACGGLLMLSAPHVSGHVFAVPFQAAVRVAGSVLAALAGLILLRDVLRRPDATD